MLALPTRIHDAFAATSRRRRQSSTPGKREKDVTKRTMRELEDLLDWQENHGIKSAPVVLPVTGLPVRKRPKASQCAGPRQVRMKGEPFFGFCSGLSTELHR
jgi:hypothetical protein